MISIPSFGAELSIEYEMIARSGVTPVPGGSGAYAGFGGVPAIDDEGNVVFKALSQFNDQGLYSKVGQGFSCSVHA